MGQALAAAQHITSAYPGRCRPCHEYLGGCHAEAGTNCHLAVQPAARYSFLTLLEELMLILAAQ
eukprot:362987-Chlamydomonas_euryale.AAC.5